MIYPHLHRDSRGFWRDLHAVTGFWISIFVLFLAAYSCGGIGVLPESWALPPPSEPALSNRIQTASWGFLCLSPFVFGFCIVNIPHREVDPASLPSPAPWAWAK